MKIKSLVVKPTRSGRSEFLQVFNQAMEDSLMVEQQDPKRLYNLRCSQIPYCPRSVMTNYLTRGMFFAMDMRMAYYVSVGHAVHEVMQRCLAGSGRFIADYECKECGKKYPLSRKYECCDFPTKYEEVSINYKGIQGHIDGIFVDSTGRVWIIDYKTCSVSGAGQKEKNPPKSYRRQVRAYAYLLWKQYGIKVVGCMLVFLPRDNPWKPAVWEHRMGEHEYEDARLELKKDRTIHKNTMKARTLDDLMELAKVTCGGEYCKPCGKSKIELKGMFTKLLKANPKALPIKKE